MHAETLRDEWTVKLPFAGYSAVARMAEFFGFFDKIVWDDPPTRLTALWWQAAIKVCPP
jgi:hypothetical protein